MSINKISTHSILRIKNELKLFENKFSGIKRIVACRKISINNSEFNIFMDSQDSHINEIVNWCHNKIAEICFVSDEIKFYSMLADLDLNLNALGKSLIKIEKCSEKYSNYCYGTLN